MAKKKVAPKKRKPTDATMRNVTHANHSLETLRARVVKLEDRVERLEVAIPQSGRALVDTGDE